VLRVTLRDSSTSFGMTSLRHDFMLSRKVAMNQTASSPQVSVIVPLFNEEENVPILQAELRAALKAIDHELIFVDDGSADRTVERIETEPNLRVIRFEKNAGPSAAMYVGLTGCE